MRKTLLKNLLEIRMRIGRGITLKMSTSSTSSKIPVQVKQGTIVGQTGTLPNGSPYYSFKGIPYASPPINELRFEPPKPLEKFPQNELDCSEERDVSFHQDPFTSTIVGSEDCLFLNVYTPKLKSNKPLPVMVWIHGGAFMFGSGSNDIYSPLYLIQEDVIVVTINYRLGVFGFLSYPEAGISGNAGLKDQLMALQWVQENIENFNGDPNNVTLFGESAGAASTHLHTYSDRSKKFFHKAIVQSGTSNMQWVMQTDATYKAKKLAKLLGCESTDDQDIGKFLRTSNQNIDILKHIYKVLTADERRRDLPMPFKPVVEGNSAQQAIVTSPPAVSLLETNAIDIPIMMGYNSNEGIVMIANAIRKLEEYDQDLARLIPRGVPVDLDSPKALELAQKMREFYFKGGKVDENSLDELSDLMSDYHFGIGVHTAAEMHAKRQHKSPLFFYRFGYCGGLNVYKQVSQTDKFQLKGACHGDELFYLFQMGLTNSVAKGSDDEKMTQLMCKLWANFAKHGKPTTEDDSFDFSWEPVKKVDEKEEFVLDYLDIDSKTQMLKNPDNERIKFWRDIFRTWNEDHANSKL